MNRDGVVGSDTLRRHTAAAVGLAWRSARGGVATLAVLAGVGAALPVGLAWVTKLVLDLVVDGGSPRRLVLLVGAGLAGFAVAGAVLPHVERYAGAEVDRRAGLAAQDRMFRALNALPGLGRFEDPCFRDHLQLAEHSGRDAPGRVVTGVLGVGQAALAAAGFVAALSLLSPWMAVLVAVSAAPTLWVHLSLSKLHARTAFSVSQGTRRQVFYGQLLSSAQAAKEVRLFGLGDFFRSRMLRELSEVNAAERRVDRRELRAQGALAVLAATASGAGLLWMALQALAGRFSVGDVSVFIAAVAGMQGAIAVGVQHAATTHRALLLFDHFQAVVRAESDLPVAAAPVPPLRHGIELRDVWFRYGDEQPWVLRGVDLFLPHGHTVALVGLNGAGKSTLVTLLCRLYDPVRGAILWDGVDLRRLDPVALRQRIGAVFQDFYTYDLSAAENIGLGDLPALDHRVRIESAARRAGAHGFLSALPRGYDTLLSRMFFHSPAPDDPDNGVLLSGGQWQRVALARAFLRDQRDLAILDEPSSGLDAYAEQEVHAALRKHRRGRTSLHISHRLSTVRDADTIVVLADGVVVEQGDHDQLIASGGRYAELFEMQAAGYRTAAAASLEQR